MHLHKVMSHPVHGKGFEVRVFACAWCDHETSIETTPDDDIRLVPEPSARPGILSLVLKKLLGVVRPPVRDRSKADAIPLAHK
jgi:hypothetical protein